MAAPKPPVTPTPKSEPAKLGKNEVRVKHKTSGKLFTVSKRYAEAHADKLEVVS